MTGQADHFLIFGTHEAEVEPVHLVAGRLAADLINGNLRTITYDGVEVLRAVSYLVRDRDWGTYSPRIENLAIERGDSAFSVSYTAHCVGPDRTDLAIDAKITGNASGRLIFEAEALSESGFETNRCGFCILHPIAGVAGTGVIVEHVDGSREDTHLPDLIDPWQPFKDMRAITHTVLPSVTAECRMEGDTFEMEDQRNWSDASYKTYVRPLALPWPYEIPANEPLRQRITLDIADRREARANAAVARPSEDPVVIERGRKHGVMPAIGLVITPEEAKASLKAASLLTEIGAQELIFHFDPLAGHATEAFRDFAALADLHHGKTMLELALPCHRSPANETKEIGAWMRSARFQPDALVISPSVDRQSTPPGSAWPECPPLEEIYTAAHAAFPGVRLGGGMLSYFTELNRKRVPAEPLDFITHCTNPIVHAADDLSVMQTLEALPFITRSVRAIYGDKAYRIGPSSIPMRQNPYGSRTMDNPAGGRIPMANRDPRHNGRFAEAFALGYAARVLDAGLECLTLSALTGPFGLIAGRNEPVPEGEGRPIFRAVKILADLAGSEWNEATSSDSSRIVSFAAKPESGDILWLVNVTAREQRAKLHAFRTKGDAADDFVTLGPCSAISVSLPE